MKSFEAYMKLVHSAKKVGDRCLGSSGAGQQVEPRSETEHGEIVTVLPPAGPSSPWRSDPHKLNTDTKNNTDTNKCK